MAPDALEHHGLHSVDSLFEHALIPSLHLCGEAFGPLVENLQNVHSARLGLVNEFHKVEEGKASL